MAKFVLGLAALVCWASAFLGCSRSIGTVVVIDEIRSSQGRVYDRQAAVVLLVKGDNAWTVPTRVNVGKFPIGQHPFDNNFIVPPHSLAPFAYFHVYPNVAIEELKILVNTKGFFDSWTEAYISESTLDNGMWLLVVNVDSNGGPLAKATIDGLLDVYGRYLNQNSQIDADSLPGTRMATDPFFAERGRNHLEIMRSQQRLSQQSISFGILE